MISFGALGQMNERYSSRKAKTATNYFGYLLWVFSFILARKYYWRFFFSRNCLVLNPRIKLFDSMQMTRAQHKYVF